MARTLAIGNEQKLGNYPQSSMFRVEHQHIQTSACNFFFNTLSCVLPKVFNCTTCIYFIHYPAIAWILSNYFGNDIGFEYLLLVLLLEIPYGDQRYVG